MPVFPTERGEGLALPGWKDGQWLEPWRFPESQTATPRLGGGSGGGLGQQGSGGTWSACLCSVFQGA